MDFLYRFESPSRVSSSPFAAGPWNPNMQHGAAPSGLIAHLVERIPSLAPMRVARMTIDLMRPVPVAPLDIETSIEREGRKLQLCSVKLFSEGTEVVRASILRLRRQPMALPPETAAEAPNVPAPETLADDPMHDNPTPFISGLTLRSARSSFNAPGPAAIWFRANRPVVEGEALAPVMRAAIASDFCNGASTSLDWRGWTFINADLSITLARDPVGEWILLDATTWLGPDGSGIAFARLADKEGYFGRAVQNLLLEKR